MAVACLLATNCQAQSSKDNNHFKTLILIIATNDQPAYIELQKVWESYMNSDPDHFDVYFLRADPDLVSDFKINQAKNEIILKTTEGFVPGILNKSILGIKAMGEKLKNYDYVIRTNLSSFYYFPNLYTYLQTLPRQKVFCGVPMWIVKDVPPNLPNNMNTIPFISGAGIIFSTDMAKLLVDESKDLEKYKTEMADDVFIGLFFAFKGINFCRAPERQDFFTYQTWVSKKDQIPPDAFHFRAKYSYNIRTSEDPFQEELKTLKELVKKYYHKDLN